jgi:hypothetical protein
MFGRQSGSRARAWRGLTLLEMVIALGVMGVLGALVLSCRVSAPAVHAPSPEVSVPLSCPAGAEAEPEQAELSLQDTLDRLGYTVNVPASFHGRELDPRGHQRSIRDDSLDEAWFRSIGTVTMQLISQQSDLGAATRFVVEEPLGEQMSSFEPVESGGFDDSPRLLTWESSDPVRFRLDFPPDADRSQSLYSTPEDNPDGGAQLMVLPVRKNGYWVRQDGQSGYWQGGEETGEYLLCWEDRTDGSDADFQDLVFVARGITTSIGPVGEFDTSPSTRITRP